MNKLVKYIPFVGLGIAAYLAITQRAARAQNIRVDLDDIAINSAATRAANYLTIVFNVRLNIRNIENIRATINAINVDLNINNTRIASAQYLQKFTLQPRAEQKITLEARISTISLLTLAPGLVQDITAGRSLPTAIITGFIDTPAGRINLQFAKDIKL